MQIINMLLANKNSNHKMIMTDFRSWVTATGPEGQERRLEGAVQLRTCGGPSHGLVLKGS